MLTKLKLLFSSILSFIMPFAKQMMTASGPIIAAAATQAVKTAVGSTGAEKRDSAFEAMQLELKAKGIEVGTAMINAAIELAVLKAKE